MAAIMALETLTRPCLVDLWTDSQYVRQGITEWLAGWKRNGWKTAAKKPVKNDDLWRRLDEAQARHRVNWHWVKGHAGHEGNERADALANEGVGRIFRRQRHCRIRCGWQWRFCESDWPVFRWIGLWIGHSLPTLFNAGGSWRCQILAYRRRTGQSRCVGRRSDAENTLKHRPLLTHQRLTRPPKRRPFV